MHISNHHNNQIQQIQLQLMS
nr:unnamed protein product [Callosobruchus analis]